MADRYATNAFIGVKSFEGGLFNANNVGLSREGDNPSFIYPGNKLINPANGVSQKIQRGYMRMIANGMDGTKELSKRRLHFQFNPDSIVRSVTARNDIQFWMNQDPSQLMQPIPGDANFAFELLFNREPEVVSGTYSDNGQRKASTAKASLPLRGAGNEATKSVTIPHSAVTDIGVLADLIVFDEIIGQGINTQLIEQVLKNAQSRANLNQATRGSTSDVPTRTAVIKVTKIVGGIVTEIKVDQPGAGYTNKPTITIESEVGSGLEIDVTVLNGVVDSAKIINGGSGYQNNKTPRIKLTGGGGGNPTSASGTSDEEDSQKQFDFQEAQRNLYNNFGNSAFLVSTPIRIVFSSLFMVEGYVTSTMVTFNKFNANMVPTQCSVGISMQALYIGFARKDTFLTLTLDDLKKKYNEEITSANGPGIDAPFVPQKGVKLTELQRLGRKLFTQGIGSPVRAGRPVRDFIKTQQIFDQGDYTQSLGFRVSPSNELVTAVKNGSITKLEQIGTWKITYMGNSASPTSLGNGTIPIGTVIADMSANSEFTIKNLRNKDSELVILQFVLDESQRPDVGEIIDTTSTSKYQIEYKVLFKIHSASDVLVASQYYSLVVTTAYNEETTLVNPSYLKTAYTR